MQTMFSRKDALEYFSKYDWDKVELLLLDNGFDPEAQEFSLEAIEKVEKTFGAVDGAVKKLSGSKENKSIVIRDEVTVIQQGLESLDIAIPADTLIYLLKSTISEYENAALMLHDAGQVAFARTLSNQREGFFKTVASQINQNTDRLNEIFDDEAIEKIVDREIPKAEKFDVDAFLEEHAEIQQRTNKLKKRVAFKDVKTDEPFDIDAFLDNMSKKTGGKA